jgi:hypothetical protein
MGGMKTIADLENELFGMVEKSQGQAFISDGRSGAKDRKAFFKWVQDRLDWNNEASKQMRAFLKKHQKAKP